MNTKTKIILQVLLLGLLTGCSTFENISQKATTFSFSIPTEVKNEALGKVNTETQLYSIGYAQITDSGLPYSTAQAMGNSKEKLKREIEKEANIIFKSLVLEMDSHRKKIFTPILPDLIVYVSQNKISEAVKNGEWNDENKSYVLLTIEREIIKTYSQKVFSDYASDLIKKIEISVLESSPTVEVESN